MSTVSVIIVNWNGRHLLGECLDALRAQTRPSDETIVVDNGSSDGSQAFIREQYPEVTLIELDANRGFSIANNIALQQITSDYIALINNDLVVEAEWIEYMAATLDTDATLGSCAPKMLFYDRRDTINVAGMSMRWNSVAWQRGYKEKDSDRFQESAIVFGACAGAAMYRMSMLHDIGFFDEDLYLYYEDVDLAFRAQLAGYECKYVPAAVAYHHESMSSKGTPIRLYYGLRNAPLVVIKNMPAAVLPLVMPFILLSHVEFSIRLVLKGEYRTIARVQRDMLRLVPRMLRKRRVIQSRARRAPGQILNRLARPGQLWV